MSSSSGFNKCQQNGRNIDLEPLKYIHVGGTTQMTEIHLAPVYVHVCLTPLLRARSVLTHYFT